MSTNKLLNSNTFSGYLYLLRHASFFNTSIYKIGRTYNTHVRIANYPKGSFYITTVYVNNYKEEEGYLIKTLTITPGITRRLDIGDEYFEGNVQIIYDIFQDIANRSLSDSITYLDEGNMPPCIMPKAIYHNETISVEKYYFDQTVDDPSYLLTTYIEEEPNSGPYIEHYEDHVLYLLIAKKVIYPKTTERDIQYSYDLYPDNKTIFILSTKKLLNAFEANQLWTWRVCKLWNIHVIAFDECFWSEYVGPCDPTNVKRALEHFNKASRLHISLSKTLPSILELIEKYCCDELNVSYNSDGYDDDIYRDVRFDFYMRLYEGHQVFEVVFGNQYNMQTDPLILQNVINKPITVDLNLCIDRINDYCSLMSETRYNHIVKLYNWSKKNYSYDKFTAGIEGKKSKKAYNAAFVLKILEDTYGFNIKTFSRGQALYKTLDKKSFDLNWLKTLCRKYNINKPFSVSQLQSGVCFIRDLEDVYIPCNNNDQDMVEEPCPIDDF